MPQPHQCIAPHKPYLTYWWAEGCGNAQTLRDEIAACGCQGCGKSVRRFLNAFAQHYGPRPVPPPPPAVADVVRWKGLAAVTAGLALPASS